MFLIVHMAGRANVHLIDQTTCWSIQRNIGRLNRLHSASYVAENLGNAQLFICTLSLLLLLQGLIVLFLSWVWRDNWLFKGGFFGTVEIAL